MLRSLQKLIFLSCFLLLFVSAQSQKQQSIWYFGYQAALRFEDDGSVTCFDDNRMSTLEGCASVGDANGNLLFYTDGTNVWNKMHQQIATDLKGNGSSSQSAIIVPKPGDSNKYYIFTSNGISGDPSLGCYYSEVDMNPIYGPGVMTSVRNRKLVEPADEKITAIGHKNGKDIWVIVPLRASDNIHAYLVTENGVSSTPVISRTGLTANFTGELGYIKGSTQGNKLAMANMYAGKVFVMNFDNSTGECSNAYAFKTQTPYGTEFSPSGRFLYTSTETGYINQYDLNAGSAQKVEDSKYQVLKLSRGGGLQMAVNKRIYMASYFADHLVSIEAPDEPGAACAPSESGVKLVYGASGFGLPNLVPTFFFAAIHYTFSGFKDCGRKVDFNLGSITNLEGVEWDLGDGYTSDSVKFTHIYKNPGLYTIKVRYKKGGLWHDLSDKVTIEKVPLLNFDMPDTLRKCDQPLVMSYSRTGATYLWNTGSTDPYIRITKPGMYKLVITDEYRCSYTDSTIVTEVPIPVLVTDTIICAYDSILISNLNQYTYTLYKWNTGATSKFIYGKPGNTYILQAYDKSGCSRTDTTVLTAYPRYAMSLGRDSLYCGPFSNVLEIQNKNAHTTKWSTGATTDNITVTQSGSYSVEVKDACYTDRDTFKAELFAANPQLGADTEKCLVNPVRLEIEKDGYHVLWSTGDTSRAIFAGEEGAYWVRVYRDHCSSSDTINIKQASGNNLQVYFPNAFSPNRDHINDYFPSEQLPYEMDEMSIYNRWGNLVFRSAHTKPVWDGRYMDEFVPDGVYLYVAVYRDCDGNRHHLKGTLTVLR